MFWVFRQHGRNLHGLTLPPGPPLFLRHSHPSFQTPRGQPVAMSAASRHKHFLYAAVDASTVCLYLVAILRHVTGSVKRLSAGDVMADLPQGLSNRDRYQSVARNGGLWVWLRPFLLLLGTIGAAAFIVGPGLVLLVLF